MKSSFQISLKAARVNARMTVLSAAKAIGIGKDTLLKWEKHPERVSPLWQEKISNAYKCPIDYIFFGRELELNSIKE